MKTHTIIQLLTFLPLVPSLGWAQQPTPQRLEKDRPIERTIGGAASHNYVLRLKKGQFCYTEIDQRGVDVVVRVFAPDGKRLQEIDSPNGTQGPEPMTLIADSTGDYRIEVSPLEPNAPVGHYVVSVIALRPAATTLSGKIDQLLVAWDKPGSPGAAVAVIQNDKIVFKKGYGYANLEYDVFITPATVFHVASVSKQFTAFCIALLAEAGKLSLDDDIRLYLPEMHDFGKKITGEFYSEELETSYRLKVQDGKLVALHQRNDMVSLTPTVTDQFAGNQWWFRGVQFQRNAQGAIAGFTITGGRVHYLRFVKRA